MAAKFLPFCYLDHRVIINEELTRYQMSRGCAGRAYSYKVQILRMDAGVSTGEVGPAARHTDLVGHTAHTGHMNDNTGVGLGGGSAL